MQYRHEPPDSSYALSPNINILAPAVEVDMDVPMAPHPPAEIQASPLMGSLLGVAGVAAEEED